MSRRKHSVPLARPMLQLLTSALPAFTVTVILLTVGIALGWMTAALRHRAAVTSFRVRLAEATTRVEARESELLRLTQRVEDLGAADVKRAALEARLEAERAATRDKLSILEMSEIRLREAFQAAGAEALRQNADAFLQLARTSLSEQQQASAQDMEARERAVAQLIAPIHESLAKIDDTLRQVALDRVGSSRRLEALDMPAPPPDVPLGDIFAAQLDGAELSVPGGALDGKATA